jgi:hypothetical protein
MPISPVVLRTENKEEFAKLFEELREEIKPTGFLEQMYVEEVADLTWQAIRLRRVKVATINTALETALKNLLGPIMFGPNYPLRPDLSQAVEQLAHDYFLTEDVRKRVLGMLKEAGLDESAIVAEAFRWTFDNLEKLDRALTLTVARRDKSLRMIAEFRGGLAARLRRSTERMLSVDNIPSFEDQLPKTIEHG